MGLSIFCVLLLTSWTTLFSNPAAQRDGVAVLLILAVLTLCLFVPPGT